MRLADTMHGEGRHGPAFSQPLQSRVKEGMGWIGKVVGGFVGFFAGPVGAAVGLLLGHAYDVSATRRPAVGVATDAQSFFFDAAFAVMGFVAKSDGRVSESEISAARSIMAALRLDAAHVRRAMAAFTRGKSVDYPVDAELLRLIRVCATRQDLLALFLEIQMRAVLDGDGLEGQRRLLVFEIGRRLGFADGQIQGLEQHLRQSSGAGRSPGTDVASLAQAYDVLGVASTETDAEVKKAYRRLMSENHPDKLVARGLPESMQELAKVKTQRIREAYELIAETRGIR